MMEINKMKFKAMGLIRGALLFVTMVATSLTCLSQGQIAPEQNTQPKKGGFAARIYRQDCFPAEVHSITGGSYDPGAFTSEVVIKSNSPKTIKAVMLGWYVYDNKITWKLWQAGCGDKPIEERPVLTGQTQLIELGLMLKNQRFRVGTARRLVLSPVEAVVVINSPLIMMSDFSSLHTDEARRGSDDYYGVFIAVREVHFEDGAKWVAEGEPPYMKSSK